MDGEIQSVDDIAKLLVNGETDWSKHGRVNVVVNGDLVLFSYRTDCLFDDNWNFFELVSRGLIINQRTGEIVARPFDKFFNWGQGGRTTKAPVVRVTDKIDGSLGISYFDGTQYRIATRGSFSSDQAIWASEWLDNNVCGLDVYDQWTLLFEIVYPENRIVVDYGEREELVLLAARNRFSGEYIGEDYLCAMAQFLKLSMPQRYNMAYSPENLVTLCKILDPSKEGFVAEFADGSRFKFKGERYLELHRIINTISFKNTLQAMENGTIADYFAAIPDEFSLEVQRWMGIIQQTTCEIEFEVTNAFLSCPKQSRKEFALYVREHHSEIQHYLFALLDGKDLLPIIYKKHDWSDYDLL